MIVVDASVAVKWFVREAGTAEARSLLVRHVGQPGPSPHDDLAVLGAPELLQLEVLAVLGKRARGGTVVSDYPERAYERLLALRLQLTPDKLFLGNALGLSRRYRHPLYDCLYLAMARFHQAPLATFDRGLADIARQEGLLWIWP